MMLAATIEAPGINAPVKLRNLSETGGLVEGALLPAEGADVLVRRLDLQVPGKVMWREGARCGVQFDQQITVANWVSGTDHHRAASPRDQVRVDSMQAAFRADAVPKAAAKASSLSSAPRISTEDLDARLGEEIAYVQRILELMSHQLIAEPIILHRYGPTLQNFDLASQILGHVARIIRSPDKVKALQEIGMEDLKARLTRKPVV